MSRAGKARPVPTRSLLVRDIQILATLDPELGDIPQRCYLRRGQCHKMGRGIM